MNQLNLIAIYRTPNNSRNIFFSSAHRIFTKIDNILPNNLGLNHLKSIKIIQSIFSSYNKNKPDIYNAKIARTSSNIWKLSKHFKRTHGSKQKSQVKLENTFNSMKTKTQHQNLWGVDDKVYRGEFIALHVYIRKELNQWSNFLSQETNKKE